MEAQGVMAERHHVTSSGREDAPALLFVHGFGCDQSVWRDVAPPLARDFRCLLFDTMGAGRSDPSGWDPQRYSGLDAYAADLLAICAELDLRDVTVVAHSIGAMMAAQAAIREPERFRQLIWLAPSPYLLDDPADDYHGGFAADDLPEVLRSLDTNYLAWAEAMAPVVMGVPERPELGERLTGMFCRNDPAMAAALARTSFTTDCRPLLPRLSTPTLILQCHEDAMAPLEVGDYLHRHLPASTLVPLRATGHCPHLSAPAETVDVIRRHLAPAA
ncbi:alpha/beta fold hydrolase [uncultured Cellulomonas sp.]|uniref:alpha/beta fold hydrolase n=1 Tax=uncultured Cellulomonas sp. TaxID=189682 RepID=UPI002628163B|nr:alpha/beta hydrolase [uncultured Cellulomonas sp.]